MHTKSFFKFHFRYNSTPHVTWADVFMLFIALHLFINVNKLYMPDLFDI